MQSMMSELWKGGLLHIFLLTICLFTKNSHAVIDCEGIDDVWTYQDDAAVFSLTLPGAPDTFIMFKDSVEGSTMYEESVGFPDKTNPYYSRITRTRPDSDDKTVDYRYNISLNYVNRSDVRAYSFTYSEGGTNYCDKTTLNIYGSPVNIGLQKQDTGQLFIGNKTILICNADQTSVAVNNNMLKPLQFHWLINGDALVETGDRFSLSMNGAHLEVTLDYSVIGFEYNCFAADEGSTAYSDTSSSVTLQFQYQPRFEHGFNEFRIISGTLGANLQWDVLLLANPRPSQSDVTCEFKGNTLDFNVVPFINVGTNYSLLFAPLKDTDLGTYTLSAKNSLGSDTVSVDVMVKAQPRAPTDFEIEKTTAASIHITWKPNWDGGETQTITLTLQEEPATDTTQVASFNDSVTSFVFTDLNAVTGYTISIVATNRLGDSDVETNTATTKAAPITDLKRVKYSRIDNDVSISLQLNVDSATHFDITVCVNNMDINCTYLNVPVTAQSMEPSLGLPDPEEEFFDINIRFYEGDILVQTVSEERIHLAEGLDRNILIGIIVGVLVGVILIAVAIVITLLILRKKRRQKEPSITKGYVDDNGTKTNGFDNTACNIEGYEDVEFSRAAIRNGAPKNPPPKPPYTLVPTYADVDMQKTNNIPMQQNNYRQPQDTVFPTYADVDMKKTNNIPMQPMVSQHKNNQPQNTGEKADKKKKKTKEKDSGAPHTENYNAEESEYYNTKADGPDDQMVEVSEAQQYAPKNPGVVYAELALNDSRPDKARGKRKPDEPVQYADINFNK